jgi:hypothetical protein
LEALEAFSSAIRKGMFEMKKKMLRIMYLLLAVLMVFQTACNKRGDQTETDTTEATELSRTEQTTEAPQPAPDLSTIPSIIWDFSDEDTMKLSEKLKY